MSFVLPIVSMIGTGLQAAGQIQAGNTEAANLRTKAASEEANANTATMQAQQAKTAGEYEVAKLERQKKQALSTQRALYAKSGVLISEGSPLEVQADTATEYQMDINASKYNTAIEVKQYEYESEWSRSLASYYSSSAKSAKSAGYLNAGSTLLTGTFNALKTLPTSTKK